MVVFVISTTLPALFPLLCKRQALDGSLVLSWFPSIVPLCRDNSYFRSLTEEDQDRCLYAVFAPCTISLKSRSKIDVTGRGLGGLGLIFLHLKLFACASGLQCLPYTGVS